jgi:hypothetical protein
VERCFGKEISNRARLLSVISFNTEDLTVGLCRAGLTIIAKFVWTIFVSKAYGFYLDQHIQGRRITEGRAGCGLRKYSANTLFKPQNFSNPQKYRELYDILQVGSGRLQNSSSCA